MFSVSAASLLVRVTPSHLRGRAQGVWAGSFLIGMIAGPAVGTVASFSLRLPFFLYAGTLVLAGLVGLGALRHSTLAARQSTRSEPLALTIALRNRAYLAALAASFAGDFALVGARSAILPQYVRDSLHLSAGWAYAAFLIVSLVSGALLLPTGKVADTLGRRPVIAIGLTVGALGFVALPVLPAIAGLITGSVLIGVAAASDSTAPGAVMGDVVAGRGGTVVAVFQMAGDLGAVLGPVVAGWIADGAGYTSTFVVSAVVCALPVLVVLASPETLRRGAPEPAAATEGNAEEAASDRM
jgi:MFS transporter, DHA1 family, multidrug resistance protein